MMNILLLGGTGAMGMELCKILQNDLSIDIDVSSRQSLISSSSNLRYIKGNAHDLLFVKNLLVNKYDVIIDFMVYTTNEFAERADLLCSSCKQYIFISSSRVYAKSDGPIVESSPRLLDCCEDTEYLTTDEYALAKARQEDYLFSSKHKNWTIVRPYITFNSQRFQMGWFEKDYWLFRVLSNKKILLFKDILTKTTTLTYGLDVSKYMFYLIGNKKAYAEVFNIASNVSLKWEEIFEIYNDILLEVYNLNITCEILDNSYDLAEKLNCDLQLRYDRLYNRTFDCKKIYDLTGVVNDFSDLKKSLKKCIIDFKKSDYTFKDIDWYREGITDRFLKEKLSFKKIKGKKNKIKYILGRYIPNLTYRLMTIKNKGVKKWLNSQIKHY